MTDYVSWDELSDEDTIAYLTLFGDNNNIFSKDAVKNTKWKNAMDVKIKAIDKNDTWELIDLPREKTIGVKWIYKTKLNEK